MKRFIVFVVMILVASAFLPGVEKRKLAVYVTGETVNGFIESGIADSVKDLKSALSKKVFQIVDDPNAADITITVTSRSVQTAGSQTSVNRGIFGGIYATNTPIGWCCVFTRLNVGDFKQDAYGYGKFWRVAATAVAQYWQKWVKTNRAQLEQHRAAIK